MRKKILSVLMAALMVSTTLLTGCGSSEDAAVENKTDAAEQVTEEGSQDDYPTVSMMALVGTVPADLSEVEEAMSEITRKEIGANVEIVCIEAGNWQQQLTLLLSGGDDTLDVYMAGYSVPYITCVNNGQALALDDLMAPYEEEMKNVLGENVYNSGKVGGTLYGIGRLLDQASIGCFNLKKEIAEEFGYNNGDTISLSELTDLFEKIKEKYPDTPIIAPVAGTSYLTDTSVDSLGDTNNLGVLTNYGQSTTVENYYESDEYLELVSCFKKWSELGCYYPDFMNTSDSFIDLINGGKAMGFFSSHFSAEMMGTYATETYGVEVNSLAFYPDSVAITPGAYYCINPACKNPDKAAGLLYLMATNAEFANLWANGIEGTHYVLNEEGTANYPEGVDATTSKWAIGYSWADLNSTLTHPFGYPGNYFDMMLESNQKAKVSKAFGCQFDTSSVSDAVSACTNVVSQYKEALATGSVSDYDATLAEFQQALRDAGIDEIIAVKQQQLKEFIAEQ